MPLNRLQTATALVVAAGIMAAMLASQTLRDDYLWIILVQIYVVGFFVFFVGFHYGVHRASR